MNFEIYAYWNTIELVNVFNAIAAITGSGDFNGLLRTLALVMIIGLVLAVLAGKSKQEDFWRWVIMLALMHGMLLVPKSNVMIVDRTGTSPAQVVANVPIGLAALAHGTSKIGDWLTTAFETVFSLPNDVQLRKTGTLFGHRVMLERLGTQFASPILMRNLDEFYRECVIPDLATGVINPDNLAKSENIWQAFANTNPGLLVTIADYADPSVTTTVSCPAAYTALTTQINTDSNVVLGLRAQGLYPEVSLATARASLANALTNTQQFFAPSASATPVLDQIKQGAMCNYIIDAPARVAAQMGDAAQVQQATATAAGIRSYKANISTTYSVAMSGMPKFRNAIEMITYSVFPIIVIMIVIAGQHAGTLLKGYVGSLLWVQLWPPLYAVMNYMMNIKSKSAIGSMVAANSNSYLSCNLTNWLGSTAIDDMNVAAYLTLSIPVVAWGLANGTMQVASGLMSTMSQGMSSAGPSGARYLDNTVRSDQITAGQYNMSPTVRTGAAVRTDVGQNGVSTTTFGDGTTAVDASAMQHKMNLKLNTGTRVSGALQQQSEVAETAAVGNVVSAATATAAAIQQSADFARSRSQGERAGTHFGAGDQSGFTQAASTAQKLQNEFAEKNGLTQTQAAEIMGAVDAAAGLPGALAAVSPVNVKATARIMGSSETDAKNMLEKASKFAKESGYSEAVDKVRRFSKEATFDQSDESSRRAMEGIRANFDRSEQHTDQASASHQKSMALKEAASRARENSGAWESGMVRQFTDWMTTQRNDQDLLGRNFDAGTVAQMAEKNPELLTPFVERFFKDRIEPNLSAGVGEVKTAGDVQALFNQGKAGIPSASDIAGKGGEFLGQVKGAAAGAGVDPGKGVTSTVPQQVEAAAGKAGQAIDAGKAGVNAAGQPLAQKATDANDPSKRDSLMGTAVANAGSAVLPSGTVWAVDALVSNIPGAEPKQAAFWRQDADNYKGLTGSGTTEDKAAGAFMDTVLLGAGGVGGKVAGKVAGEAVGGGLGRKAAAETSEAILEKAPPAARNLHPGLVNMDAAAEGAIAAKKVVEAGGKAGANVGAVVGAVATPSAVDGAVKAITQPAEGQQQPMLASQQPVLQQPMSVPAQAQPAEGQQTTGDFLAGSMGGSNLGNFLGGGQRQIPMPASNANELSEQQKSGDSPPPSGR